MNVQSVSLAAVRFGYGQDGTIFEISDELPDRYWKDPRVGWSPLLPSRIPGMAGVLIKYEGSHLSGSFKDRIMGATLGELLEREPDCPGVVVPSSGNAAVSAAALCARLGLPMVAVVPRATPDERLMPIRARGALLIRAGEGPSQSYALADRLADALGYFRLYSTFASPWAEWGCRSLGLELGAQCPDGIGMVVAPVSAGPVLVGTANGLRQAGVRPSAMVAVQAAGCAPIAAAFGKGEDTVVPWIGAVDTEAAAIADRLEGYPQDGTRVLSCVKSSGGAVGAVTDDELAQARAALFEYDGIDAEFSACAGVAWLRRQPAAPEAATICVVTASGFKHTFAGDAPIAPGSATLRAQVAKALAACGPDAVMVN